MAIELQSDLLKKHRRTMPEGKSCEWPGCDEEAPCRAPKSPEDLNSFRWFCKEHAREYNKSWNYYKGMSDEEVEADVRRDTVWRRPTWKLGTNYLGAEHGGFDPGKLDDPLGIFDEPQGKDAEHGADPYPNASADQRRALTVFSIDGPVTEENVKQRYKELVKRHHPDAARHASNSRPADLDEKMKEINEAYRILMDFIVA